MSKVLFADTELTLHRIFGDQITTLSGAKVFPVESFTILPGQFVALEELPPYQREAATQGKISGARVMKLEEAELLEKQAARLKGEVPEPLPSFVGDGPEDVELDDGEEETPDVEELQEEELVKAK